MNGDDIRKAREAKGWSQARLAEEANTTQPRISALENGRLVNVETATLERVAAALGLELVMRFEPIDLTPRRGCSTGGAYTTGGDFCAAHDPAAAPTSDAA